MNPEVGTFVEDLNDSEECMKEITKLMSHRNIYLGYHLNFSGAFDEFPQILKTFNKTIEETAIFHSNLKYLEIYEVLFAKKEARYNFIPDKKPFLKIFTNKNGVILRDAFIKRTPNAEYLNHEVEWFSSDHLDFKEEGYLGFSDFSIVGEAYTEKGFGAKAVAFHIVFPDDSSELWVRHFVSDSNDDRTNPAGKFGEALYKFADWYESENMSINETEGLKELLDCYKKGNYPGLGMLKRYTIKHHLEIVGNLLVGNQGLKI
jgi:hypothetical protein